MTLSVSEIIYIYIYLFVCVCVCVSDSWVSLEYWWEGKVLPEDTVHVNFVQISHMHLLGTATNHREANRLNNRTA